jgi:hypothetical protein
MLLQGVASVIGYTTWPALKEAITLSRDGFECDDLSVKQSVTRVANAALTAIEWHS